MVVNFVHTTKVVSVVSIMGAVAISLSILRIEFPFPILIYLKFDLAEIPTFVTYYIVGGFPAILCATIHFLGLLFRGSEPLGASMKFLAIISTISGMVVARRWGVKAEILSGALIRIIAMSIANIIVLALLFPGYLAFAKELLKTSGLSVETEADVLIYTLVLTAIYNALHTALSILPSLAIVETIRKRLPYF